MKTIKALTVIAAALIAITSCKGNKTVAADEEPSLLGPSFNEDSAMAYCAAQCEFGPRTMNSEAHDRCEEWIVSKFKQHGCEVTTQKATLTGWDGTALKSTNIIARLDPENQHRILLCAHWDSRPWADNDPDEANHRKPVLAANDGASGVGVMLELARTLQGCDSLAVGIDFVCFDAEDYGTPSWSETEDSEDTWALGAQHYAKNLDKVSPLPSHGILLDMVGGQGAKFHKEGVSLHYAKSIVDDVWQAASDAGYGSFFPYTTGGFITDDHKPLNEAGLPTIDIIPYYEDCEASAFGPTWHTISDDMNHLDKNVLKAVGQTLIQYLFSITQ